MKIRIFIEFAGRLAELSNFSGFWVFLNDGSTIGDLLKMVEENKGVVITKNPELVVLVNGRPYENLDAKLKDLDKVVITPISVGG